MNQKQFIKLVDNEAFIENGVHCELEASFLLYPSGSKFLCTQPVNYFPIEFIKLIMDESIQNINLNDIH